jgi:tetratricopeptide (TPR) repeat protein
MKNAFKLLMVFLVQINSYVIAQDVPTDSKAKESQKVIEDLIKATQLNPNDLDLLNSLGNACWKAHDYEKAEEVYEDLIAKRTPPLAVDYFSLGRAYYFGKKFPAADSAFSKLIEMQPKIVSGYLWRARTKSGMDPETKEGLAQQDYKTVVKLGRKDPEKFKKDLLEAYKYFGYYYYLTNRRSKAEAYWKKVLELEPNDQMASDALKATQERSKNRK